MEFRQYHLFSVLKSFGSQTIPLDVFLSRYFRNHKALGSKDRLFISETIYHYIRWKNLFDYLKISPSTLLTPVNYLHRGDIPLHVRYGMPYDLYDLLIKSYGEEETQKICLTSNSRAPLTIRANGVKTTRDALLNQLKKSCPVSSCRHAPLGIYIHEKINLYGLEEFKEGLFEVQDEASQLASLLIKAKPKQQLLDYCAGAGGKTLAVAPLLNNTGQMFLHDIRPFALREARRRLKRAGIYNAQFGLPPLKKTMDWVIVDLPCTGTGTLRRNPDLKWKFDSSTLDPLLREQREIFRQAIDFLHPHGTIVYMTCSLLPQENEKQIDYFTQNFSLKVIESFKTPPIENGMDGFFAVALKSEENKISSS